MRFPALLLATLAVAVPSAGWAISRHDKPSPPRIGTDKAGRPVARFKLVLRSEGLPFVRVGLGRTKISGPLRSDPVKVRALLEREDPSFIVMHLAELSGLPTTPVEHEFEVPLDRGIAPGEQLDVFTSWHQSAGAKPIHFFGIFSGTGVTTLTMPQR